jgi:hypothetical protein
MTATGSVAKRVRISEPESLSSPTETASESARRCILDTISSLHPAVQPLLTKYATKYFGLAQTLQQRNQSLTKMSDTDFIARSVKLNFQLTGNKRVTEHATFTTLQAAVESAKKTYHATIMENIRKAAELDRDQLKLEMATLFYKAALFLADTFRRSEFQNSSTRPVQIVLALMYCAKTDNGLKHRFTALPADDQKTQAVGYLTTVTDDDITAAQNLADSETFSGKRFVRVLDGLFHRPFIRFEETSTRNELTRELTSLATTIDADVKSEEIQMVVDSEKSMTSASIKKLVDDSVAQCAKTIVKQLKNTLPKNYAGAKVSGAESKKSGSPQQQQQQQQQQKKQTKNASKTKQDVPKKKTSKSKDNKKSTSNNSSQKNVKTSTKVRHSKGKNSKNKKSHNVGNGTRRASAAGESNKKTTKSSNNKRK